MRVTSVSVFHWLQVTVHINSEAEGTCLHTRRLKNPPIQDLRQNKSDSCAAWRHTEFRLQGPAETRVNRTALTSPTKNALGTRYVTEGVFASVDQEF